MTLASAPITRFRLRKSAPPTRDCLLAASGGGRIGWHDQGVNRTNPTTPKISSRLGNHHAAPPPLQPTDGPASPRTRGRATRGIRTPSAVQSTGGYSVRSPKSVWRMARNPGLVEHRSVHCFAHPSTRRSLRRGSESMTDHRQRPAEFWDDLEDVVARKVEGALSDPRTTRSPLIGYLRQLEQMAAPSATGGRPSRSLPPAAASWEIAGPLARRMAPSHALRLQP